MKFLSALLVALAALAAPATQAATPAGPAPTAPAALSARAADACARAATAPAADPRYARMVAEARRQHRAFGSQAINRAGAVVATGYHASEWEHPRAETLTTWQRVAGFWTPLDPQQPPEFRVADGTLVARDDLLARIEAGGVRLSAAEREALETALLRSALMDLPWSAAFISHLAREAGFAPGEFTFSDSHVDYVDQAVQAGRREQAGEADEGIYRACDPATTRPRPGDLLCHTRASTAIITRFADLLQALDTRRATGPGSAFPMHCDLVVLADRAGDAKLEVIGGNVMNTVTLRKMTLDARRLLSRTYVGKSGEAQCEAPGDCRANLNRKPWLVLLQARH